MDDDELRAAAERLLPLGDDPDALLGQRVWDGIYLARAWLAEHPVAATPASPPPAADDAERARAYADTETGRAGGFTDTPQGIAYRAYLAGVAHERGRAAKIAWHLQSTQFGGGTAIGNAIQEPPR